MVKDPLAYLPRAAILLYSKGEVIYGLGDMERDIYLIVGGSVKISRPADCGGLATTDIYARNEFFGESALLGLRTDTAMAFEKATVMRWTAEEIEKFALSHPQLSLALIERTIQRSIGFGTRIDSFAVDNIATRLARALIHFSETFGHQVKDGSVQIMPFTHEVLSRYIGTTRENVTRHMNNFRQNGYVRFSRGGIWLYPDAMSDWLKSRVAQVAV